MDTFVRIFLKFVRLFYETEEVTWMSDESFLPLKTRRADVQNHFGHIEHANQITAKITRMRHNRLGSRALAWLVGLGV